MNTRLLRYFAFIVIGLISISVNAQPKGLKKVPKKGAAPYVMKNVGRVTNRPKPQPQQPPIIKPVRPIQPVIDPTWLKSSLWGRSDREVYNTFKKLLLKGDTIGAFASTKENRSVLSASVRFPKSILIDLAIRCNDSDILYLLSGCYKKGLYGVVINSDLATKCLFHAANLGHFYAQIEYGDILWNTNQTLVAREFGGTAVKYWAMADTQAEKDTTLLKQNWNVNANHKYLLGYCFYNGIDTICNIETSIDYLEKGVKMGNVESAIMLGYIYSSGEKILENDSLAAVYMNYAAQKGDKTANAFMGNAYYYGTGVQRDSLKAIPYYRIAALMGDGDSQSHLAVFYYNAQDYNEAILWGSKPECRDDADTQFIVGSSYFNSIKNDSDYDKAVEWLGKAAKNEHPQALWELAMINKNIYNNDSIAFSYFCKCANMGNAEAMNEVGCAYLEGSGVEQNVEKGIEWLKLGAYQGNANAAENLASIYQSGKYGIKRNKELCLTYWKIGAENGSDECQYNYGMCLKKGKGVPKDKEAGVKWISEAASKGHLKATEEMKKWQPN